MPDHPEGSLPRRRPAARKGRRVRFSLPADHHDDRAGERIEAFLEGPPVRARRTPRSRHLRPDGLRRPRAAVPMDTRADWEIAFRHEEARVARYSRPAAVLAVRVRMSRTAAADSYAGRVGGAIRQQARETDRVTRVGPDRFQVLLPETAEAEATVLAARVRSACVAAMPGTPGSDVEIIVAAASTAGGRTLHDALLTARAGIEDTP